MHLGTPFSKLSAMHRKDVALHDGSQVMFYRFGGLILGLVARGFENHGVSEVEISRF